MAMRPVLLPRQSISFPLRTSEWQPMRLEARPLLTTASPNVTSSTTCPPIHRLLRVPIHPNELRWRGQGMAPYSKRVEPASAAPHLRISPSFPLIENLAVRSVAVCPHGSYLPCLESCIDLCEKRTACTGVEFNSDGGYECSTYTGGSANVVKSMNRAAWTSCLRRPLVPPTSAPPSPKSPQPPAAPVLQSPPPPSQSPPPLVGSTASLGLTSEAWGGWLGFVVGILLGLFGTIFGCMTAVSAAAAAGLNITSPGLKSVSIQDEAEQQQASSVAENNFAEADFEPYSDRSP